MATTPKVLTFAEFEQLPDPPNGRLELRQGEPFLVPPPRWKHQIALNQLQLLLLEASTGRYRVIAEANGTANVAVSSLAAQ